MAKFKLYKNAKGEWSWRLCKASGPVIAVGTSHRSRNAAVKEVEQVKQAAMSASTVDLSSGIAVPIASDPKE